MRIKTYFGIPFPPFKATKLPASAPYIVFAVRGSIPSKKNQKKAVTVRNEAVKLVQRTFKEKGSMTQKEIIQALDTCHSRIVANQYYNEFLKDQHPKMIEQMAFWSARLKDRGLIFPIEKASLSLKLYFRAKYITDTANKQQTIQDLLVDCGVISDDNYQVLNPIHTESACYKDEITEDLALIMLSIPLVKRNETSEDRSGYEVDQIR